MSDPLREVFDPPSVLSEADVLVSGDRRGTYGHPLQNFSTIAEIATPMLRVRGTLGLGQKLTAQDIALIMIAVKLGRESFKPKRDNLVDAAGYIKCLDLVNWEEARIAALVNDFDKAQELQEAPL